MLSEDADGGGVEVLRWMVLGMADGGVGSGEHGSQAGWFTTPLLAICTTSTPTRQHTGAQLYWRIQWHPRPLENNEIQHCHHLTYPRRCLVMSCDTS